jgi:hypothetical protein
MPIWRKLFRQLTVRAFSFPRLSEGSIMLARMLMIDITTSNSINVNALILAADCLGEQAVLALWLLPDDIIKLN